MDGATPPTTRLTFAKYTFAHASFKTERKRSKQQKEEQIAK